MIYNYDCQTLELTFQILLAYDYRSQKHFNSYVNSLFDKLVTSNKF